MPPNKSPEQTAVGAGRSPFSFGSSGRHLRPFRVANSVGHQGCPVAAARGGTRDTCAPAPTNHRLPSPVR